MSTPVESYHTPRVLLVWEHGDSMGHHAPLGALSRELVARGCTVDAIIRQVEGASGWYPPEVELHAAPAPPRTPTGQPHLTYTDVLASAGWMHPRKLQRRVRRWRKLVFEHRPDVVVLNSAPTVHLALHGSSLPIVGFGSPWFAVPPVEPLPRLAWWEKKPVLALDRDRGVLAAANHARAPESPPLQRLADVWRGVQWALQGPRELDPWRVLRDETTLHLGSTAALDQGEAPEWPAGDGPKVFAYIKRDYPARRRVLAELERRGCRTLVITPGLEPSRSSHTHVCNRPVSLRSARAKADLLITHSALATGCAFLAAGVPGLFLPMHLEQLASGRCASMRLKGAATVPFAAVQEQLGQALDLVLHPAIRAATEAQTPLFETYEEPMVQLADRVVSAAGSGARERV